MVGAMRRPLPVVFGSPRRSRSACVLTASMPRTVASSFCRRGSASRSASSARARCSFSIQAMDAPIAVKAIFQPVDPPTGIVSVGCTKFVKKWQTPLPSANQSVRQQISERKPRRRFLPKDRAIQFFALALATMGREHGDRADRPRASKRATVSCLHRHGRLATSLGDKARSATKGIGLPRSPTQKNASLLHCCRCCRCCR